MCSGDPQAHGTPMQGDGVPPAEAREFCNWVQSEAPAKMDGTCFSVLALGDRCAPGWPKSIHSPCSRSSDIRVTNS